MRSSQRCAIAAKVIFKTQRLLDCLLYNSFSFFVRSYGFLTCTFWNDSSNIERTAVTVHFSFQMRLQLKLYCILFQLSAHPPRHPPPPPFLRLHLFFCNHFLSWGFLFLSLYSKFSYFSFFSLFYSPHSTALLIFLQFLLFNFVPPFFKYSSFAFTLIIISLYNRHYVLFINHKISRNFCSSS